LSSRMTRGSLNVHFGTVKCEDPFCPGPSPVRWRFKRAEEPSRAGVVSLWLPLEFPVREGRHVRRSLIYCATPEMNRKDDELTWSGCHGGPLPGPPYNSSASSPFTTANITTRNPTALSRLELESKEADSREKIAMSKEVSVEGEQPPVKDYTDPPPEPLLNFGELRLWSFYRALIAEFVATLLFLYVTIATVIGHKEQNAADQCSGVGLLGIAWAFGGMIFILVYCTAGISGPPCPPFDF
ncbi:hypothetical protein BHE74_00030438, partial [Ensete ventricosum]